MKSTKERLFEAKVLNPKFGYRKLAVLGGCSYSTARYHLNPDFKKKSRIRNNKTKKKHKTALKLELVALHGGRCKKCGYNKCIAALEFHHKDPKTKNFDFSKANSKSKKVVLKEFIKKCILLCSNCHRELHFKLEKITDAEGKP